MDGRNRGRLGGKEYWEEKINGKGKRRGIRKIGKGKERKRDRSEEESIIV